MSKDIFDNEIIPNGYGIYCKNRASRGGGVLLAVKDNITSSRQLESPPDVEITTVLITTSHQFIISIVYIPPNSSDIYHELLHSYLTSLVNDHESAPIILLGDFNFPDIDWDTTVHGSSSNSTKFCDLLFN